jgi:hypothetical protein
VEPQTVYSSTEIWARGQLCEREAERGGLGTRSALSDVGRSQENRTSAYIAPPSILQSPSILSSLMGPPQNEGRRSEGYQYQRSSESVLEIETTPGFE